MTSRGNNRENIFKGREDRVLFLAELERALEREGWVLLAYCLMGNHYHLVILTPEPNLGSGMRTFLSRFVVRVNPRHGRDGHMFKSRFHSSLVDSEAYFACLLRYVALNPVKDGFCSDPAEWEWSSHMALLRRATSKLVDVELAEALLDFCGGEPHERYARLLDPLGRFGTWSDATSPVPQRPAIEDLLRSLPLEAALCEARRLGYSRQEIADVTGLSLVRISSITRQWAAPLVPWPREMRHGPSDSANAG